MSRILVTGGLGFIGSNLVRKLDRMGYNVDIVDDMSTGILENVVDLDARRVSADVLHLYMKVHEQNDKKKHLVILGDFVHRNVCDRIMSGIYDYVFHFAGNTSIAHSIDNPTFSAEVNFLKTVELFRISAKSNIKRLVFASSFEVYGDASRRPTPETTQCNPKTPHGLHKLQCEQSIKLYKNLYGLNAVSLRYFDVYGPHQLHNDILPTSSISIAAWCHAAMSGNHCKSIVDGIQSRDLIYIDDAVTASILAAQCQNNISGQQFNIASGKSVTYKQLLDQFAVYFGNDKIKIDSMPWSPGEIMHSCADITKMKNELKFETYTSLDTGLKKTWEWWHSIPDYLLGHESQGLRKYE